MLDFLFLSGQAASALLLLYGGYLAFFHAVISAAPESHAAHSSTGTPRSSAV